MSKKLHITNGDVFTQSILDFNLGGEIITWKEMLCEGPTSYLLGTPEFIKLRTNFLNEFYSISPTQYKKQFLSELNRLTALTDYTEVILWFEFDLFSHINMLAAISHLMENKVKVPFYLVCSRKLKGEKEFNPLSKLSDKDLKNHYDNRILLDQEDLETANLIWQLYNEDNPQKLKGLIKRNTNFEYLSSCIRAHIERFPNSRTGLNALEKNVLNLIQKNSITSINQLMGYAMEYQGYFGYGHRQIERLLHKLEAFYKFEDNKIVLSAEGVQAIEGTKNFYRQLKNDDYLGGVKMYDFLYDSQSHNILKL
ncbi:DUF1835 domain-containing protein [Gillisia sp. M10.2A]|uniref:DUF1835 domain-containing protein n=1 Tax=Gillisia lutea TaxID=2909668 RepID=A0ABS9EFE8_9FLAO|nr:DUF1835 domain-containing protein [Gillisia lutea]MCF4101599.1 DUF1835 domain-containing protein [Gillisia lutea]